MTPKTRYLSEVDQIVVGRNILVLGYDPIYKQPVVDAGQGATTLARLQRLAWDQDREAVTSSEEKLIHETVRSLKEA